MPATAVALINSNITQAKLRLREINILGQARKNFLLVGFFVWFICTKKAEVLSEHRLFFLAI